MKTVAGEEVAEKESVIGTITNCWSTQNRIDVVEALGSPHEGFFDPLYYEFKGITGLVVSIDAQPLDHLKPEGFKKARKYLYRAVEYMASRGAKSICFTASTKRLGGESGLEIKKMYPNITFTIGDSTTFISFLALSNYFLTKLKKEAVVVCIGAGFLGERTVENLISQGFKNIYLLTEQRIKCFPPGVTIINSLEKLPTNIEFLACCAHKYQIDPEKFRTLFAESATILDVSVPKGINQAIFQALPPGVKRYDGGDFYLPELKYDFDSKLLGFPGPNLWYGCFTENLLLDIALRNGRDLSKYNFFAVNKENINFMNSLLKEQKNFQIPLFNIFKPEGGLTIPF